MAKKLYIGNLAYRVTEKELEELFAKAGRVESVKIITDSYTGQSRGFGFVEMSSPEEAEKAISMFNKYTLANREIIVNEARPKPMTRGGGGGGPRGFSMRHEERGQQRH